MHSILVPFSSFLNTVNSSPVLLVSHNENDLHMTPMSRPLIDASRKDGFSLSKTPSPSPWFRRICLGRKSCIQPSCNSSLCHAKRNWQVSFPFSFPADICAQEEKRIHMMKSYVSRIKRFPLLVCKFHKNVVCIVIVV
jgi:hypothetical protein